MTKILGIDCSSTTIGYCVLEIDDSNNIKFVSCNYIKPIKKESIVARLADTRDKIKKIIESVSPDHIVIEDIIQFMSGASTAKTIITLTSFNRMIGLLAYDFLKKEPNYFNVMTIRHGIKLEKTLPKKEDIPDLVAKHLQITFPYQINKKGCIKVENYDMADSIAVALYYSLLLTKKIKGKKK
jgi:Holliday junction resolvasome RuvABC endonuclease subunit